MEKTVTKFGGTETEKYTFYQYKSHVLMENIGINKIVAYKKVSFSKENFKYFIGQKYAKEVDLYAHFFQK